jgi:hypothetical protein
LSASPTDVFCSRLQALVDTDSPSGGLEQEGVDPDELDAVGRRGIALMLAAAEETLRRYDTVFDTWSSERSLHESGAVERALGEARDAGHVYESEGATWLRTTSFGVTRMRSGTERTPRALARHGAVPSTRTYNLPLTNRRPRSVTGTRGVTVARSVTHCA